MHLVSVAKVIFPNTEQPNIHSFIHSFL